MTQKLTKTVVSIYLLGTIALPLVAAEQKELRNRYGQQGSAHELKRLVSGQSSSSASSEQDPSVAFADQGALQNIQLLTWYASQGDSSNVQRLLDANIDVNQRDRQGFTALHRATMQGKDNTVHCLLERKANPSITFNRIIDIDDATIMSCQDMSRNLKRQLRLGWHVTALHCAAAGGYANIIELLLKAKADANASKEDGETPLHVVARDATSKCTRLLLNAHASIDQKNEAGRTPLAVSQCVGHAQALIEAGAAVTQDVVQGSFWIPSVHRPDKVEGLLRHVYIKPVESKRHEHSCPCVIL